MNISAIQSNKSQPNFEACYVNKKSIRRSFGQNVLSKIEEILPEIKKQSVDVDTFIYADHFGFYNRNNGIRVVVQKLNVSFLDKLLSKLSLRPPYNQDGFVFTESITAQTVGLLDTFKETKNKLANYM